VKKPTEELPLMVAAVLDDSKLENSDDEFERSNGDLDNSDDDLSDYSVNGVELDHMVEPN
ncbi:hypothetical protein IWQ61_010468, partial [Dispira simplex]